MGEFKHSPLKLVRQILELLQHLFHNCGAHLSNLYLVFGAKWAQAAVLGGETGPETGPGAFSHRVLPSLSTGNYTARAPASQAQAVLSCPDKLVAPGDSTEVIHLPGSSASV
jgi:hypothetical protein